MATMRRSRRWELLRDRPASSLSTIRSGSRKASSIISPIWPRAILCRLSSCARFLSRMRWRNEFGTAGRAKEKLGLEHRVPVEIVHPAFVQIVRRKQPAVVVKIVHRRLKGLSRGVHMHFGRQTVAFAQIAAGTGGDDIFPSRG